MAYYGSRYHRLKEAFWLIDMVSEKGPLLSICIPTYNRSSLLKVCLLSILEQIKGYEEDVEVVVSDNCSDDATPQVVEWASKIGPIRYHRNKINIGGGPNFMLLSNELAKGEYCWLLGDDDFVRKDSLSRLVGTIKANPDVDLFFTNAEHIYTSQISHMKEPVSSAQFTDDLITCSKVLPDHLLDSFDALIDPVLNPYFSAGMQWSIFRRKLWLEVSNQARTSKDDLKNVETTFPHSMTLARCMRGRKVFYFGNPVLVVGDGSRSYMTDNPMVVPIRLFELLNFYESIGISHDRIRKCRNRLLWNESPSIFILSILGSDRQKDYVNYKDSISKYVGYKEFWLSFFYVPIRRLRSIIEDKKKAPGPIGIKEILRFY